MRWIKSVEIYWLNFIYEKIKQKQCFIFCKSLNEKGKEATKYKWIMLPVLYRHREQFSSICDSNLLILIGMNKCIPALTFNKSSHGVITGPRRHKQMVIHSLEMKKGGVLRKKKWGREEGEQGKGTTTGGKAKGTSRRKHGKSGRQKCGTQWERR